MDDLHALAVYQLADGGGDYITRESLDLQGFKVIQVIDADEGCTVGFVVLDGDTVVTAFHWSEN